MISRLSSRLSRFSSTEQTPITETIRDFLSPIAFYEHLKSTGFDFYTGVPDSLLSDFLNYIGDNHPPEKNIIAANEGTAIGIASGWHLATRKYPLVYMQNAGLGNAVNPLLSLADPGVYQIPMLLLIGWRGEPGKSDEPQHKVQGSVMPSLLESIRIPFEILPDYEEGAKESLEAAREYLNENKAPYALLVRRRTFVPYSSKTPLPDHHPLTRERTIGILLDRIKKYDAVIATSGFTSRELYYMRISKEHSTSQDFYCLGARGHNAAVTLGVAISKPSKNVFCLDGDGSFIMHMGTITTIGTRKIGNFKHIVFNNIVHETAGGMPSVGDRIDFPGLALACGYTYAATATTEEDVIRCLDEMRSENSGPSLLEIRVKAFTRYDLRGLVMEPRKNKEMFMGFLNK